jgi:alpha-amylase
MRSPSSPSRALRAIALLAALASVAAACGGGGGAGPLPPVAPAPPPAALPPVDLGTVAASDPGLALPPHWQRQGVLQVFVRSYQDSGGDGVGDLQGLISRLDHIRDLGVAGIWLLPINPSQDRDHGYAVTDYRGVEPGYGTLEDFDALVAAARVRGLGLILDHVMNHSAAQHPAFVNSRAGSGNVFRDWYVWSPTRPTGWSIYGGDPWRADPTGWYFAPFWEQMPDFNLRHPVVVAWHLDHLRFWLNRGVAGFRFDAVGNLIENGANAWNSQPESLALMRQVRQMMDGYERRVLVCEGPDDPDGFQAACGSAFAFGHQHDLLAAARGDAAALARVAAFAARAPLDMARFLSNHDGFAGERPFDQLGGDLRHLRNAASLLVLLPGVPYVYYGEEVGMGGGVGLQGDPRLRSPMSWQADVVRGGFTRGVPYRALARNVATHNVESQASDPGSLLSHYRQLFALRAQLQELRDGVAEDVHAEGTVLRMRRSLGTGQLLVALNTGEATATATFSGLSPGARYAQQLPAGGAVLTVDDQGRATVALPPHAARVLRRLPG